MKIKKILNNNAVVIQEYNEEKIVLGSGIAFQKQKNDLVDRSKIEKIFVMTDSTEYKKFEEILKTLPEEHIQVAEQIISYAEQVLNTELSEHIHIALTDHLSFAMERLAKGLVIKNKLLNEIKVLYRQEFQIGLWAKNLIKEKLAIEIPEDEVGYIALHIHTAKMNAGDMQSTLDVTTMIRDVVELIERDLHLQIDEQTILYQRLLTHLRYAFQRLESDEPFHDLGPEIVQMIKEKFPEAYACARRVGEFLKSEYAHEFPETELAYIALHIQRMCAKNNHLTGV